MKENLAILIIPSTPLFSNEESDCFPGMNVEFSGLLRRALYLNYMEFFKENPVANLIRFVFYESEREKLNGDFLQFSHDFQPFFLSDPRNPEELLPVVEKLSLSHSNIILIKTESMGLTPSILSNYINLLNVDNDILVISKSKSGLVVLNGFNNYDPVILRGLRDDMVSFEDYFASVSILDKMFFVMEDLYSVKTIEDFRNLYNILSQKENYSLCSLKIHEMLTDVFIEYKEVLK
ncbi:MAG: hypothetical protein AB9882_15580 [Ignavibacteriaceae bacterium]